MHRRKMAFPRGPIIWQMPKAAKEAVNTTPMIVAAVTMALLIKYWEIPLFQAVM